MLSTSCMQAARLHFVQKQASQLQGGCPGLGTPGPQLECSLLFLQFINSHARFFLMKLQG